MRALGRRDRSVAGDFVEAAREVDCAGGRGRARGGAQRDSHQGSTRGGWRHREAGPEPRSLRESRAQAPDRGVRDGRDRGAGGVGGLTVDRAEEAVVHGGGGPGTAGAAQARPAPLPAATQALEAHLIRRRPPSPRGHPARAPSRPLKSEIQPGHRKWSITKW